MPVNIFDILPEKKELKKSLSLWFEFGILACIFVIYIFVFLVYFPQYLSKNRLSFWAELLLVPLLLCGCFFFFRAVLWSNENIEVDNWNKTRSAYYAELLKKGMVSLNIIDLQIRLPDLNGGVVNMTGNSLLPVRYAPKYARLSRYLTFNSSLDELNDNCTIRRRSVFLFNDIMNSLISNIHAHLALLPDNAKMKVVCVLDDDLKPLMESIWTVHFDSIYPVIHVEFCESLPTTIDNWLDDTCAEYIILIAANFHGAELLNDDIDNTSESVMLLFGKLKQKGEVTNKSSLGGLFRPEFNWEGIDKSLIWGRADDRLKLSGVVYAGLDVHELKKLVLKTTDFMSESALSSYNYIDSSNYMGICPPLTEFLQVSYISENLPSGGYLLVNKYNDLLTSYFFYSVADGKGAL